MTGGGMGTEREGEKGETQKTTAAVSALLFGGREEKVQSKGGGVRRSRGRRADQAENETNKRKK